MVFSKRSPYEVKHSVCLNSTKTKIYFKPGEKRRDLGPRNDVLTTCKAVTQRGGQRIITEFFPQ